MVSKQVVNKGGTMENKEKRAVTINSTVEKKYPGRFYSSESARSFIQAVAYQFTDPWLMLDFFNALDIVNAALVSWLIEEKRAGIFSLLDERAAPDELRLAAKNLRAILGRLQ
jgi:hypothetical protein